MILMISFGNCFPFKDSNFLQQKRCWGTIVIVNKTLQTYGPHTTVLLTITENIHSTKLDEHRENIIQNKLNKLSILTYLNMQTRPFPTP